MDHSLDVGISPVVYGAEYFENVVLYTDKLVLGMRKTDPLAKKREMEEAAKAMQEKEGVGKFKPRLMTYNDVTKTAEPFDPDKLANEEDDDDILADYDMPVDDDMPSEEELAVYDTDYLNADDDEEIIEEENEERK